MNKSTVMNLTKVFYYLTFAGAVICAVVLTSLSGYPVRVVLEHVPAAQIRPVLTAMLAGFAGCTALCIGTSALANHMSK